MPFSTLQFWLPHCQPSCSPGKSAHHHHPPLMNFLGEAAMVSVIFLHCPPPMFNYSHGVFYKLPGNGIANPHTVHKGEKWPPLPSPAHEFHREGSIGECCLFILIPPPLLIILTMLFSIECKFCPQHCQQTLPSPAHKMLLKLAMVRFFVLLFDAILSI